MNNNGSQTDEEIDKETRKIHRRNWFLGAVLAVIVIAVISWF